MASLTMDDKTLKFEENGQTILDVARAADIYIPTLCDHPELPPHGGCRMCLVEVEGMKGFVTACTTPAKDGMLIRTSTDELMKLKRNILKLLLIEHPSACLVCDKWNFCQEYRKQPYKAGQITGCNMCPNRNSCELREVFEYMGIAELGYTPTYRQIPVEREDPFFERDYNICILCGRCVRICDEIRGTSAITFSQRGHRTRVDTAFGNSHIDSGCWFCGACIDVCPTGALSPKMTKWHGGAESIVETTCILCGTGCQMQLDVKWDRLMATGPGSRESSPNYGHMCVLGRFCVPSLVNASDRIKNPLVKRDGVNIPVSWEVAYEETSEILRNASPERIGFIGSPQMSNESSYVFQKLARVATGTSNLDFFDSSFASLVFRTIVKQGWYGKIGKLDSLASANWVLAIGGDFVKTHQVVAKTCYQAVRNDAPLILLGNAGVNLQRWATIQVPTKEKNLDRFITSLLEKEGKLPSVNKTISEEIRDIVSKNGGAIIIGPGILSVKNPGKLLNDLIKLAGEDGLIFPTFVWGNEVGTMFAGIQPDLLPGPLPIQETKARLQVEKAWGIKISAGMGLEQMRKAAMKRQLDVLYVADGSVPIDGFEKVPFIIYQSPYPSDWIRLASVVFPSTTFVEESGTVVNMELEKLKLVKAVVPPGQAKQDWMILIDIARRLDAPGFDYNSLDEIEKEMAEFDAVGHAPDLQVIQNFIPSTSEWNPKYRGATMGERIRDLASFLFALPKRDRLLSKETLDDLVKRVMAEDAKRIQEVAG